MVVVLSLSGKTLGDCSSVLEAMKKLKVVGDITQNKSIDPGGNVEPGCRVMIAGDMGANTKHLWEDVKRTHGLGCAHMFAYDVTYGCVWDTFAKSNCPDKL